MLHAHLQGGHNSQIKLFENCRSFIVHQWGEFYVDNVPCNRNLILLVSALVSHGLQKKWHQSPLLQRRYKHDGSLQDQQHKLWQHQLKYGGGGGLCLILHGVNPLLMSGIDAACFHFHVSKLIII